MLRLNGILRRVSQTKLFLEYLLVAFGSKLGSKLQFKHSSVLVRLIGCHRPFRQRSFCKTFDCLLSLFCESKNCSLYLSANGLVPFAFLAPASFQNVIGSPFLILTITCFIERRIMKGKKFWCFVLLRMYI